MTIYFAANVEIGFKQKRQDFACLFCLMDCSEI